MYIPRLSISGEYDVVMSSKVNHPLLTVLRLSLYRYVMEIITIIVLVEKCEIDIPMP